MTWTNQHKILIKVLEGVFEKEGKTFSMRALEKRLGLTQGKTQHWKKGQRPSADDLAALAREFDLSPAWLLLGEGDPVETLTIRRLGPNAPSDPACIVGPDDKTPVGRVVPVHATVAGGPALDRWEPVPICHVCIPLTYYRESVLIVQISGRSMEPEIRSGAFVGLDTAQVDLVPGEKYGVRIPYEGLTVKRVFIDPKAKELVLRSINPEHPEMRVGLDDRDGLIVGRAVWVMQGL